MSTTARSADSDPGDDSARPARSPALGVVVGVLAAYAAIAATISLSRGGGGGDEAAPPIATSNTNLPARDEREVRTAVADEMKRQLQDSKNQWSAGLEQQERWKREIVETLADASRKADALVKTIEARVESFEEQGRAYGPALKDVADAKAAIAKLAVTVKRIEDRPVAVAAPPSPAPGTPGPTAPPPPVIPTPASDDPEAIKEKVKRALQDVSSPDPGKVWTACVQLGKYGGLDAVEPLLKVLKENKDTYARLAAVTALGQLKACDAMPALIEALIDKDSNVYTAANSALTSITAHVPERTVSADTSKQRRNEARAEWVGWWKSNEAAVRAKLNQPPKGAAAPPIPEPDK